MSEMPSRRPDCRYLGLTLAVSLLAFGLVKADAQGLASIPFGAQSAFDFAIKRQHLDDPRLVHGVLRFEWFSMIRAIGDEGTALAKPTDWTEVDIPLAPVILGPTEVVPWTEQ